MRRPFLESFFDEMSKIGASAAVNAGQDPEMVLAKPPSTVGRVLGGAMGAGMVLGNAPLAADYAKGRTDLWHGTNIPAAENIMSGTGIDPAHAGAGRRFTSQDVAGAMFGEATDPAKRARINRSMMAESLNRLMENHKIPITHEQMLRNKELFHELMDRGMKSGEAANHIFDQFTGELTRSGAMTPDQVTKIKGMVQGDLSRHGQRSYFGRHAADVAQWGTPLSEAELAAKAARKAQEQASKYGPVMSQMRGVPRSVAETATGGLPTTLADIYKRFKYKPHSTEDMTLAQVQDELKRMKTQGSKAQAVFGASVPTGQMGYLEDFPVFKRVMQANPGLRHSLKQFGFETYEPGRDISTPHGVPSKNIHTVDLVDEATGKIRRIRVSDAVKAARSPLKQRLKGAVIPTALVGLGAHLVHRAIKPKERKVPKGSLNAAPIVPAVEKAASVRSDMAQIAKYVLPIGAVGTATGMGAHHLMSRALPQRPADTIQEQALEGVRKGGRLMGAAYGSMGALAGAGALLGPVLARRIKALQGLELPTGALRAGGAMAGALASIPAAQAVQNAEQAHEPETDPIYSMAPEKVRNFVRRHPTMVGGATGGALATAIPLSAAYAVRKYYPSLYAQAAQKVRSLF